MSPFVWRLMMALALLLALFVITTVTMTLVLVTEVRDNDVNDTILRYVEVANWIMVGLIGVSVLAVIFATPYFVAYTRRSESIVSTGLRSARLNTAAKAEAVPLPPQPVDDVDPFSSASPRSHRKRSRSPTSE